MKITEAKQKLMELADGKYHILEYQITDQGNGRVSQNCKIYMQEHGWFEGKHWESTLNDLEATINGKPAISEDIPVSSPNADSIIK